MSQVRKVVQSTVRLAILENLPTYRVPYAVTLVSNYTYSAALTLMQ